MAVESAPRSRRAILAAGLGGLAATVAGALGRNPAATRAADGDPVLAGSPNQATSTTLLTQATAATSGLAVTSPRSAIIGVGGSTTVPAATKSGVAGYDSEDSAARGVYGQSGPGAGVLGESTSGRGVYGKATAGTGVRAQSDSWIGAWVTSITNRAILATTGATTLPAISAQNTGGRAAVQGFTGAGTPPAAIAETGVEGVSNSSAQANGVVGRSSVGAGVWGAAMGGLGVIGTAEGDVEGNGVGLYGFGPIGLYAEAPGGGLAAQFAGPTFFTESGKVTISSGSSIVVAIPSGIRPSSLVLAVLHSNRGGIWVRAVVPNVAAGTATIYLNTSVPSATFIAWFVVN
jgi:hypothetical protein